MLNSWCNPKSSRVGLVVAGLGALSLSVACGAAEGDGAEGMDPGASESVSTTQQAVHDPNGNICIRSSDRVVLFTEPDGFSNPSSSALCVSLSTGRYSRSTIIGLPNDSISSYSVGSQVVLRVCIDEGWGGGCFWPKTGAANLPPGLDNAISSVEVYPVTWDQNLTFPASNQVAIFSDANFSGNRDLLTVGTYGNALSMGLPNDVMSSIRVGAGVTALLCVDAGLSGCSTVSSDSAFLPQVLVPNDAVSSMIVEPRCAHDLCVGGDAILGPSCDPCATQLCDTPPNQGGDPFCCSSTGAWDGICVSEVKSFCGRTCADSL
jgi:hypothetical protein